MLSLSFFWDDHLFGEANEVTGLEAPIEDNELSVRVPEDLGKF